MLILVLFSYWVLEVHARSKDFREKSEAAQTLRSFSSGNCSDKLKICGRFTERMSNEGKCLAKTCFGGGGEELQEKPCVV